MDGAVDEMTDATRVKVFPQLVPMENAFPHANYFVRDCYPMYYDLVLQLLQSRRGVTITGTPGIGKSVFMAYFFDRYSELYSGAKVILLSYTKKSKLTKVVVAQGGQTVEKAERSQARMEEVICTHTENATANSILLIDGPPDMIQPPGLPWVSFTSPNEDWLAILQKNEEITYTIFMPTWTLEELRDAAAHLGYVALLRTISDTHMQHLGLQPTVDAGARRDLIDYCFDTFGGVPRSCFSSDDSIRLKAFASLKRAVDKLTLDQIWSVLSQEDFTGDAHRLFHYVPKEYPFEFARIVIGSVAVKRLIMEREETLTANEQAVLEKMLRYAPEGRTLGGYLLEARAYRSLVGGCEINARKLCGEGDNIFPITVSTECGVGWVTNSFDLEAFDRENPQVVLPTSKNLESIDGFYWQPASEQDRVVLFQVTVSMKHPVKARGLCKVLQKLNVWGGAQKPLHEVAALVFVVPHWNDTKKVGGETKKVKGLFQEQPIETGPILDDDSTLTAMRGIANKRANDLAACGIRTVGELMKIKKQKDIPVIPSGQAKTMWSLVRLAQTMVRTHRSEEEGSEGEGLLLSIPQYVWGI